MLSAAAAVLGNFKGLDKSLIMARARERILSVYAIGTLMICCVYVRLCDVCVCVFGNVN